ncbi:hypothetical protein [Geothrix sp. 21YS21S-4]|uniref:hypothetical protein n=1 Tax=Geothrix sp. 21YS21S-4 TaxID=3068889 RepID=UPI0027BA0A9C|nr:hypothetical protein [Geothrix sp. 21YS21S-4]
MRAARLFLIPMLPVLSLAAQDSALNGAWTQTKADDIPAAINTTVADMSFITRPIARARLTKLNPAYRKLALAVSAGGVDVKFDDRAPIHMLPGGAASPWTREDGDTFMVSAQVSGDQLIQTFKNNEGERTNVFKLGPDGKSLTLTATIKSAKLPKPLTYAIQFGR